MALGARRQTKLKGACPGGGGETWREKALEEGSSASGEHFVNRERGGERGGPFISKEKGGPVGRRPLWKKKSVGDCGKKGLFLWGRKGLVGS